MTTNEGRCEPGPGTEEHTHHWIGPAKGDVEPWLWADGAWWRGHQRYTPQEQAARGWVYDSPCHEPAAVTALVAALEAADQFIRNGIELGFIRMPDASTPDPALQTPDKVSAALAAYREAGR